MRELSEAVRRGWLAIAVGAVLVLAGCGGGGGGGGGSDGGSSGGGGSSSGGSSSGGSSSGGSSGGGSSSGGSSSGGSSSGGSSSGGTSGGGSSSGGGAVDTTPPTVLSVTPAVGATNVVLNTVVTVTFTEQVDCASVTASSFTLAAGGSPVAGTIACSGSTASFTPSVPLAPTASHLASVTAAVKDLAGNTLAPTVSWTFTTGAAPDTTRPTVLSVTPLAGSTVALDTPVTIAFSERVDCATVTASSLTLTAGDSAVAGTIACSGSVATFTPSAPLPPTTSLTATVTTAVKDLAGNGLAAEASWRFTTGAAPDTTAPTVVSVAPAAGATDVGLDPVVTVSFSEAVDCASVTASSLTLTVGGSAVAGTIVCSGGTATFTPSARLAPTASHTATVTTAVKDLAGNALAAAVTWAFTTGAAPDTTPPAVASVSPAAGATSVALDPAVIVTFSEAVDCSTVTSVTFTLKTATNDPIDASVTCSDRTATLRPSVRLTHATEHVATVAAGVRDLAGNGLGTDASWRFTTRPRAWGTATLLESGDGAADAHRLAVNAAGAAAAVWVQADAANQKHLWLSRFEPTSGWSAPDAVESLAGDALQPQVVIDAKGDTLVAWTQKDATGLNVWTRVRAADGSWSVPWPLWGDAPALGIDRDGNVTCVWRHNDGTRTNVWASRFPLGADGIAGGWSAAVFIEADDARSIVSAPSVAVSRDGDATAVWTFYDRLNSQYTVTANRFSAASGSWGTAVDVTAGSSRTPQDPAVVMNDAGEAVAFWRQEYLSGTSYFTIISTARHSGGSWGAAEQFPSWVSGLMTAPPSVAANGKGDLEIVWAVSWGTCDQVGFRRYEPLTGWRTPGFLSASACADRPAAALDPDGNAMVAWGELSGTSTSILKAARYDAAGARWDTAAAMVGSASAAMLPVLRSDAAGNVIALWLQWDGTGHNLLANRFE